MNLYVNFLTVSLIIVIIKQIENAKKQLKANNLLFDINKKLYFSLY